MTRLGSIWTSIFLLWDSSEEGTHIAGATLGHPKRFSRSEVQLKPVNSISQILAAHRPTPVKTVERLTTGILKGGHYTQNPRQ